MELVVVIIVMAVISAIAVARFVDFSSTARIAAVKSAYGAVLMAASFGNTQCLMASSCGPGNSSIVVGPGGITGAMLWGYPTGLSRVPGYYGIKDWVQLQGFTTIESFSQTVFTKDDSPDPSQCKVIYTQPNGTPPVPSFSMTTSGC